MTTSNPPVRTRKTALAPDLRRLDDRAARAWTERMAVRRLGGARYGVDSESGATYVVDLDDHTCTCPDHEIRGETCKHLRRVAIEITTRRVAPPGKRPGTCRGCGAETFVREVDERTTDGTVAPPLCDACRLEPGDVVRDRERGDRLVVTRVSGDRADEVRVGPDDRPVADYETNDGYPSDDIVVEAVYLGEAVRSATPRQYSFPRSRLDRVDDAALVA